MHIYGNDSLQTYFQGYSPRARKCSFCKPRSAHPVPCEKNEGLEPARAPSAPAIYGCLHVPRPRRAAGCMYVCVCVTPDITGCYRMLPDVTGCYRMLPDVTGCYRMLPDVTGCYRVLPDITGVAPRKPGRYARARTTRCQNHGDRRQKLHCCPFLHIHGLLTTAAFAWALPAALAGTALKNSHGIYASQYAQNTSTACSDCSAARCACCSSWPRR